MKRKHTKIFEYKRKTELWIPEKDKGPTNALLLLPASRCQLATGEISISIQALQINAHTLLPAFRQS
jgi:hypothetical protein